MKVSDQVTSIEKSALFKNNSLDSAKIGAANTLRKLIYEEELQLFYTNETNLCPAGQFIKFSSKVEELRGGSSKCT